MTRIKEKAVEMIQRMPDDEEIFSKDIEQIWNTMSRHNACHFLFGTFLQYPLSICIGFLILHFLLSYSFLYPLTESNLS